MPCILVNFTIILSLHYYCEAVKPDNLIICDFATNFQIFEDIFHPLKFIQTF